MAIAASVVAVGVVAGSGFAVRAEVDSQRSIAATERLAEGTGLDSSHLGVYTGIAAARAKQHAEATLRVATDVLADADDSIDSSTLASSVASLGDYRELNVDSIASLSSQTDAEIAKVRAATAEAERVRKKAEADAQAAAVAAAEVLAAANTVEGAQSTAQRLAADEHGWGEGEFSCLVSLWSKESGWDYTAYNAGSGATGIPQALPGEKMATAGSDWRENATTQIRWGLGYISSSYGSPCSAWGHSQALDWY